MRSPERLTELLESSEKQIASLMTEKHKLERACIDLAKQNAELQIQLDREVSMKMYQGVSE